MPTTRREPIQELVEIHQLSPGVRFGRLLADLGFLVEVQTDQVARDGDDRRLPVVLGRQ